MAFHEFPPSLAYGMHLCPSGQSSVHRSHSLTPEKSHSTMNGDVVSLPVTVVVGSGTPLVGPTPVVGSAGVVAVNVPG